MVQYLWIVLHVYVDLWTTPCFTIIASLCVDMEIQLRWHPSRHPLLGCIDTGASNRIGQPFEAQPQRLYMYIHV